MGKLNVKSGVGTFSNIKRWKRAGDTRAGGERGWDGKRRETTTFLSLSHSLSSLTSLPRPNSSRV